jgi:DNA-binding response OmpR family regulator
MTTAATGDDAPALKVLVYSDDRNTRAAVRLAVGRRPAPDLPRIEIIEVATEPVVISMLDAGEIDLAILDGEATPVGGMGICRQLKDEIFNCPPVLVLIGRPHDGWLATWSRADGVVPHPLDPFAVLTAVAELLRQRRASVPTVR